MKKIIKSLIAFVFLCLQSVVAITKHAKDQFQLWKQTYHPNMTPDQENYRLRVFALNLQEIQKFNQLHSDSQQLQSDDRQVHGVNQFTLLTNAEFQKTMLNDLIGNDQNKDFVRVRTNTAQQQVPQVQNKQISHVQNLNLYEKVRTQGRCGSCWAFAACANLEYLHKAKTGQNIDLSEQQLVDCSDGYKNKGCNGGWPHRALQYVRDNGLSFEKDYPYVARKEACRKQGGPFRINHLLRAPGCSGLVNALQYSTVSVAVDSRQWKSYKSGIVSQCGKRVNHAVLLVGVTKQSWLILNSWGNRWGEKGFIRLALGNTCGICIYPGFFAKQ